MKYWCKYGKDIKLVLFVDNTIIYIENLKYYKKIELLKGFDIVVFIYGEVCCFFGRFKIYIEEKNV